MMFRRTGEFNSNPNHNPNPNLNPNPNPSPNDEFNPNSKFSNEICIMVFFPKSLFITEDTFSEVFVLL